MPCWRCSSLTNLSRSSRLFSRNLKKKISFSSLALVEDPSELILNLEIDILERFQLSVYLLIVAFRNLSEVSATGMDLDYVLFGLFGPLVMVWVSEILVDWLKHAFITKFNHIHPEVYARFMNTLAMDFCHAPTEGSLADQSPAVSRRIGFSSFPLTCLLIRILMQTFNFTSLACWSWNGLVRASLYFLS